MESLKDEEESEDRNIPQSSSPPPPPPLPPPKPKPRGPLTKTRLRSLMERNRNNGPTRQGMESLREEEEDEGGDRNVPQSSSPPPPPPPPPKPKPRGPLTKKGLQSLMERNRNNGPTRQGMESLREEEEEDDEGGDRNVPQSSSSSHSSSPSPPPSPHPSPPKPKPRGPLTKKKLKSLMKRNRNNGPTRRGMESLKDEEESEDRNISQSSSSSRSSSPSPPPPPPRPSVRPPLTKTRLQSLMEKNQSKGPTRRGMEITSKREAEEGGDRNIPQSSSSSRSSSPLPPPPPKPKPRGPLTKKKLHSRLMRSHSRGSKKRALPLIIEGNVGVEQSSQPLASYSSLIHRPPKPKPRNPLTKKRFQSMLMRSKKIGLKGPSEHRGEDEAPQMQAPQPKQRGPLNKRKLQTLLLRGRSVSVENLNDDIQPENKKHIRNPLTRRKLPIPYQMSSLRKVRRTRRSLYKSASNASIEHGPGQKSGRQSSLNVKKQQTSGGSSSDPLTRSQSHGTGAGTDANHFPSPAQDSTSSKNLEAPTIKLGEPYRLDPELIRRLGTLKTKRKKLARWHKQ
ncbi:hypothetical protein OJ253_3587 [Cryptosporidium canis]|uniref:Uncharacterized protein n=1 Tax=Cryptosporidium canis TaxID=195482 RepID=A0A9D5HVU0_9CRYT|nr:hypothetical protein OJ253_3587 [Cryptosporidium canis]